MDISSILRSEMTRLDELFAKFPSIRSASFYEDLATSIALVLKAERAVVFPVLDRFDPWLSDEGHGQCVEMQTEMMDLENVSTRSNHFREHFAALQAAFQAHFGWIEDQVLPVLTSKLVEHELVAIGFDFITLREIEEDLIDRGEPVSLQHAAVA